MASNPVFPPTPTTQTGATFGVTRNALLQTGRLPTMSLSQLQAAEKQAVDQQQQQPLVSGLAALVLDHWQHALRAKQMGVEQRIIECERARQGVYDPQVLQDIMNAGGSKVFVMLTSSKCRTASSWIRDVAAGSGHDKPWGIEPTPVPELSPDDEARIEALATQYIMEAEQLAAQAGRTLSELEVLQLTDNARREIRQSYEEKARERARLMEAKMEDQLIEGRAYEAMEAFVDDIVTYPSAIIKGPVLRRRLTLKWQQQPDGSWLPVSGEEIRLEWHRVDPHRAYPGPQATTIDDSYFIERHNMTRGALESLIGVPGYNDDAIRAVLQQYPNGYRLSMLMQRPEETTDPERNNGLNGNLNVEGNLEALQYWGSVPGRLLREWGMSEEDVPNPTAEYAVEVWLVGHYVIKAVLNIDPLGRKPYYMTSYERVPGRFWGNSVYDLIKPCQEIVNATARSLVNNMAFASGPQVAINVSRLAEGEEIERFFPWKIWQMTADDVTAGGDGVPVRFFQPDSNAQELMAVFTAWNQLADEYSGVPRYLAGENPGTPGRTAQGMSILMSNAARGIRQVIGNISRYVWVPMIERLYDHNMKYSDDPELKGDVKIRAAGLAAALSRETEQQRRQEFLQLTANPIDLDIIGKTGRAELLRAIAQGLNMNIDKIVPSRDSILQAEQARQMAMQAMAMQDQQAQQTSNPSQPAVVSGPAPGQPVVQ